MNNLNASNNPFVGTPRYLDVLDSIPAPLVHDAGGGVTYIGYTKRLGIAEDTPEWHIRRITVSGGITRTEYAQGSFEFSFAWSDRTTLSYSR